MTIAEQITEIVKKNPATKNNLRYLIVSVWEAQGLRLYPHQRELLLSDELSGSEAITRAARRLKSVDKPVARRKRK